MHRQKKTLIHPMFVIWHKKGGRGSECENSFVNIE